jgi:hypothetical protein
VIAGKSMPAEGKPTCFAFVQTYDTKPKRRLFEVLTSQGMQANQQITFFTDGGEDIRDLPLYLNIGNHRNQILLNGPLRATSRGTLSTSVARSRGQADPHHSRVSGEERKRRGSKVLLCKPSPSSPEWAYPASDAIRWRSVLVRQPPQTGLRRRSRAMLTW